MVQEDTSLPTRCPGCQHPLEQHYLELGGCMVGWEYEMPGESNSGVATSEGCDCTLIDIHVSPKRLPK